MRRSHAHRRCNLRGQASCQEPYFRKETGCRTHAHQMCRRVEGHIDTRVGKNGMCMITTS